MIDLVESSSFPYDSFIVQRQESSISCEKQHQRRGWQRFLALVFLSRRHSNGSPTATLTTCTSRSCQSLETDQLAGCHLDPTSDSDDDDSSSSDQSVHEECPVTERHDACSANKGSTSPTRTDGAADVTQGTTSSLTDVVANTNASIRDFIKESMHQAEEVVTQNQDYQKGLELYRHIVRLAEGLELLSSQEWIHICYMCTRYAMAIGDYETAYHFALKEMQYSLGSAKASPGASPVVALQGDIASATYIAMAERYHDLARICQYGLGDTPQALLYYQSALEMEQKCLHTCTAATIDGDHALPLIHGDEIRRQIQETKKSIGRIQFELGDIDAALGML